MTPHAKEIPIEALHRQESLRVSGGFEPPHLSLALAGRLMRDFCSIVLVLLRAVHDGRQHEAVGSRVAAKLVCDQTPWRTALPFQQLPEEAFGRTPIAPGLDEDVDHVAVLVDGPPEGIVKLTKNRLTNPQGIAVGCRCDRNELCRSSEIVRQLDNARRRYACGR